MGILFFLYQIPYHRMVYLCQMKSSWKAHLSILVTTLIFGIHYSVAKGLMSHTLSPSQVIFLRLSGGAAIFWLFQKLFVHEKIDRRDLLMLALCGLVGFGLNQALFYQGLSLTSPVDASLIHLLNPVLVLIFAHLILKERITWLKVSGITLGASGALILVLYGRHASFSSNQTLGNILVLLNMLFYALYLVLIKPMVRKYHTTTILKWVSLFGFIFIMPFTIGPAIKIQFASITMADYLGLGYVIVVNTFIAYLLINFALKHLSPGTISYYNYIQPFIASTLSISVGQGGITVSKVVAALLIFGGVYLVNYKKPGGEMQEPPSR